MSDSDEAQDLETVYCDAAEVRQALDLPSEPLMVEMTGRNVGFMVVPDE